MFRSYLKIAIRNIVRHKSFSFINILGLAISMSTCLLVILVLADLKSYDKFHAKKDRIYQLIIKHPTGVLDPNTPYAVAPSMANIYPEIESFTHVITVSQISNSSFKFFPDSTDQVKAYEPEVVRVNSDFFDIFDFKLVSGNSKGLLERPESVVISSRIAQTYFRDLDPIGHEFK